jgi:hypothetical protein
MNEICSEADGLHPPVGVGRLTFTFLPRRRGWKSVDENGQSGFARVDDQALRVLSIPLHDWRLEPRAR